MPRNTQIITDVYKNIKGENFLSQIAEIPHYIFASKITSYIPTDDIIPDPDKNILWSAMPEAYDKQTSAWKQSGQYRASVITRSQLEQMIWAGKAKNDVLSWRHP